MIPFLQYLAKFLATERSMRRKLVDAETGRKKAEEKLAELQGALHSLGFSLGLDDVLSAISGATERLDQLILAVAGLRDRARNAEARLSAIGRMLVLPEDAPHELIEIHTTAMCNRAKALEPLHKLLRPGTKSVDNFARYINRNAADTVRLRQYLGLPSNNKSS